MYFVDLNGDKGNIGGYCMHSEINYIWLVGGDSISYEFAACAPRMPFTKPPPTKRDNMNISLYLFRNVIILIPPKHKICGTNYPLFRIYIHSHPRYYFPCSNDSSIGSP